MNKLILGIDTSFDETSVSIVRGLNILANVLPSQMEFHSKYGGVVPSLAKLAHQERIDNVIEEALKRAQVEMEDLDLISVTQGPGLAIALEVGIKKSKELSEKYHKPLIAVNHMEGHLLSCFAQRNSEENNFEAQDIKFPALGFLISGGHTELILIRGFGEYQKIGETLDDSCGEAYDKCGRMLGLGYPAGPVISEFAKNRRKNMRVELLKRDQGTIVRAVHISSGRTYELPVPMLNSGDLNFSYSGLKTAFKQLVSMQNELSLQKEIIYDLCVSFEAAAIAQLTIKLEKAIKVYSPKEVWLGGGVVASARLRSEVRKACREVDSELIVRVPHSKKLTGDNAAMIAIAAAFKTRDLSEIKHSPENGIYLKDFDLLDRDPSLSL
jgi:N6-L-threonylcarbamoyladenine synthase